MVSHSLEMASLHLVRSLEDSLQALARLHAAVVRLQPVDGGSSPGFPTFSLLELNRLRAVIRQGGAAITRRLKELADDDKQAASRAAEFWRGDATLSRATNNPAETNDGSEPASRSLLVTYRAACRAICRSLQEAQRVSDSLTVASLSGLLQRLEKQLWLLDYSRERVRVGLPTITLFLSC
jgi:hypothetical protein